MKCWAAASALGAVVAMSAWADEFTFDSAEFDKKTFEFSGYLEQKEEGLKMRSDSPGFKLAYPGKDIPTIFP